MTVRCCRICFRQGHYAPTCPRLGEHLQVAPATVLDLATIARPLFAAAQEREVAALEAERASLREAVAAMRRLQPLGPGVAA